MHLTLHTDYALRVLMYLALRPGRRCTIEEIAGAYGISRNHLMKVALTLAREGFVDSLRGRSGGLMLAMKPQQIGLGAVVRKTEDSFDLVECFDAASNTCVIAPGCRLKAPLAAAAQAFLGVLDGYTLADLTASPATARTLGRLLGAA